MRTERDWRAEEDARTLAVAMKILNDNERHSRAVKAAKYLVLDEQYHANCMKKIAGEKVHKNSMEDLNSYLKSEVSNILQGRR